MVIDERVVRAGTRSPNPTYVYDLASLRTRLRRLALMPVPRKRVFFATMANDHPDVLREVLGQGLGVFVNSPKHLALALDVGFRGDGIVFAASSMSSREMLLCIDSGVRLVLDSLGQLSRLASLAPRHYEVGIRLSVGSALRGGEIDDDPSYRFGIRREEIRQAIELAARAGVRIVGAHSYFGTDVLSPVTLATGLERLCRAASALPDLSYVDAGGGFAVSDSSDGPEFDTEAYGTLATRLISTLETQVGRSLEFVVEPGRYAAAQCGYYFVTVEDVKHRHDRVFVGTNGSVATFPRPLLYPERGHHPCLVLGDRGAGKSHALPLYICGNSTYSQDFLARGVSLPLPEPGDRMVFFNAGAYCRSMRTEFLGKDYPEEITLDLTFEEQDPRDSVALQRVP